MSLSERPERKASISEVTGYAVLTAIVAGFFALHVWAGNMKLPGTRSAAVAAESIRLSGD
jgi:multidrug resistance efflux pump